MPRPEAGFRALLGRAALAASPWLGLACVGTLAQAGAAAALVPLAREAAAVFGAPGGRLEGWLGMLLGLFAARALGTALALACGAAFAQAAARRLREGTFARALAAGPAFWARFTPAEVTSRLVVDLQALQGAAAVFVAEGVPGLVVAIVALGLAVSLDPRLALASLVGLPLVMGAIGAFSARIGKLAASAQASAAGLVGASAESLERRAVVLAFRQAPREIGRFTAHSAAWARSLRASEAVGAFQQPVVALLHAGAIAGVLWVAGAELAAGRLALPSLLAFGAALGMAIDPTLGVTKAFASAQGARSALARLAELHRAAAEAPMPPPGTATEGLPGAPALAIEDLSVRHPGALRQALAGVSLTVARGERVVVVGPSGAGKSTLIAAVLGLLPPEGGTVRLSGVAPAEWAPSAFGRRVCWVPQSPQLFAGTIAENLRFGAPEASEAALWDALERAQAADFVRALPGGLEARLGPDGEGLSGGQRQRLAVARALVPGPALLLCDEPTASLDPELARAFYAGLGRLAEGRTLVVVAHTPAALAIATRVVVLEDGRVSADGPPEAVAAAAGFYERAFAAGA